MKAVLCKTLDGPGSLVLEDIPDPTPGPGEVVIKVKAAALNFFDTLITRGKYQKKPELPFSPSGEVSGVVEALGENVTGLKVSGWRPTWLGVARAKRWSRQPKRSFPCRTMSRTNWRLALA